MAVRVRPRLIKTDMNTNPEEIPKTIRQQIIDFLVSFQITQNIDGDQSVYIFKRFEGQTARVGNFIILPGSFLRQKTLNFIGDTQMFLMVM